MLKFDRVTKVKVLFPVLAFVSNFRHFVEGSINVIWKSSQRFDLTDQRLELSGIVMHFARLYVQTAGH